MDNLDTRESLITFTRSMTNQVNGDIGTRVNVPESTMTSRLSDFMRMNPYVFFGFMVRQYPQAFIDEVYKIEHAMGMTSRKKWS